MQSLITRRALLTSFATLPLAACVSETARVRYKVIATVEVNNQPMEASTVMEVGYGRVKHSLVGTGGATKLYGEALLFDLPNGRSFYIMPFEHEKSGELSQIWETAVLQTLGVKSSVGGLTDTDFSKIKGASGRMPFRYFGRLPTFASFGDETVPGSIFEFDPTKFNQVFPKVSFKGLEIEITGEPVTDKIRNRLLWLNNSNTTQVFPRDPRKYTADRQKPLAYLINITSFYGNGSR